ncbi:MAG: lamin tail domain-containing protein [Verrucomicrobiota bacterium]
MKSRAFLLGLACLSGCTGRVTALEAAAVFNEIQYHPAGDGEPEWIELRNRLSIAVDLGGWQLSGGVDYRFPVGTTIAPGGYVVISGNPAALQTASGLSGVLGPWSGNLSNAGEELRLRDLSGRLMDEMAYNDRGGWPAGADGSGCTLSRRDGHEPGERAAAWTASRRVGGTPGAATGGLQLGAVRPVFGYGDVWRYHDVSAGLAAGWAAQSYADGQEGWKSGPGLLGFPVGSFTPPVLTPLANPAGHPTGTYYFQKEFVWEGDAAQQVFTLRAMIDDGAVIYVNGTEVARRGMVPGEVTPATASQDEIGQAEETVLEIPSRLIRAGVNTVSAEVHQAGRLLLPGGSGGTGLNLLQVGGSIMAVNYSRAAGAIAFAKDVIPAAPTHSIAGLNNGTYGNASSWIGNSLNSFCGISFGAQPVALGSVAWGRDSTGQFSDRCAGTYTLEYTTVPNPNAATTTWTVIGSVTYPSNGSTYSIRRLYGFPEVQATGIRLRCPGNSFTDGACIDELEAGPTVPPPAPVFTLMATGGKMNAAANLAIGATAFAKDLLGNGSFAPTHTIGGLNDGIYGNPNSWIGNSANSFAGIAFASPRLVARVAFGRDNTGSFADRAEGIYTVQYTTVPGPTAATPEASWTTVGTIAVNAALGSPALRHVYAFAPVEMTGIRVIVPGNGVSSGACVDELEVYGPQEPDVLWGAGLERREIIPAATESGVRITELAGAADGVWRVELRNLGNVPVELGGWKLSGSGAPQGGHVLGPRTLAPGEFLVLDESVLGFRPGVDDRVFLFSPGAQELADVAVVKATGRALDGAGRMLVPAAPSFGSAAQFSLNADVVISEIMYHCPGSAEEWIELHNRGAAAVDLSGWQFSEGISFRIPAGTSLPAGGYLVVSNGAVALRAKWPGVVVLGDFDGQLSNRGERILLEDAVGNPADEVLYEHGGRWPSLADGNGSTLELRDASADNAHPGSWVASDESQRSVMQEFRYRMVAAQPVGPTFWNELRLGMLDAGVCHVDDLSVVRDPDGARAELMRNGSFDTAASWRFLGNHGASTVVSDGAQGNVLRLVATGPAETNHNHAETTFAGNVAVVNGQTYEVSFRARWISGLPRLGVRAYYSKIGRAMALPVPERLGTPGAANPQSGVVGPALSALRHEPVLPLPGESVTVSVAAEDARGVASVVLRYRVSGDFQELPMTQNAGRWSAVVPGQTAGTVVQFHVAAKNASGAESRLPSGGPESRALYVTDDGQRSVVRARDFRVVMRPDDAAEMLQPLNLLSNALRGATLVVGGRDVFYDAGIRLQGSAAGRARDGTDYQGFNVELPIDQPYLGIYGSIGFDRSGRAPAVRRPDEIYGKHLFHRAGLPCTRDDLAYLLGPTAVYSGACILQLNGYNGDFADDQFGVEGSIFNFDGTYEPTTTTTSGNVESLKNPVPFTHHTTDLTWIGSDKEHYRGFYDIRVGKDRDDYGPLMAMCQAMSLTGTALDAATRERIDVDQWLRCTALVNLLGVDDSWFTGGFPHNARFFVPTEGRAVLLPWDMDFLLSKAVNSSVNMTTNNLRKLTQLPANNRAYLAHVRDLCQTVLDPAYVSTWLAHYGSVTGHDYAGSVAWLAQRRTNALGQLPAAVPFAVSTNGGVDFQVDALRVTLAGTGWLDIDAVRLAGNPVPLVLTWTSPTAWRVEVPLGSGPNELVLEALGRDGAVVGTDRLTVTSTVVGPSVREFLRIAEVHYHPADPVAAAELAVSADADDYEFIELLNTGTEVLDLSGVRFTQGTSYAFPAGLQLAGGARLVLVRHAAAFAARYGTALVPAGSYGPARLSNRGETLTLVDGAGVIMHSVTYRDEWSPLSDGGGHSLVVRGGTAAEVTGAAGWGLGGIGGSPLAAGGPAQSEFALWQHEHFSAGELADPGISGPLADARGDGVSNLLRYAFGLSPRDEAAAVLPVLMADGGGLRFEYRLLRDAADLEAVVEQSDDLAAWRAAAGQPVALGDAGGGTLRFAQPLPVTGPRGQARLSVRLR